MLTLDDGAVPRTHPEAAGAAGTDPPEQFTRRFAFRGVQFGNWVSAARRRTDLTDASEGLEDPAAVLGWPARTLSLGGALGLAFGARGRGRKTPRPSRGTTKLPCARLRVLPRPGGEEPANRSRLDGTGHARTVWRLSRAGDSSRCCRQSPTSRCRKTSTVRRVLPQES